MFDDSNTIAGSECCPAWHIGQCHDHPMACCGDVRSVIFYWEFDLTIQHKQNLLVGLPAYIVAMRTALAGDRLSHFFVALFLAGLG